MAEDHEALRREAEQCGLTNLSDQHLAQLAKAKASAECLLRAIPRDLNAYQEPAHVYRANEEA